MTKVSKNSLKYGLKRLFSRLFFKSYHRSLNQYMTKNSLKSFSGKLKQPAKESAFILLHKYYYELPNCLVYVYLSNVLYTRSLFNIISYRRSSNYSADASY